MITLAPSGIFRWVQFMKRWLTHLVFTACQVGLALLLPSVCAANEKSQTVAFQGAEGFGRYAVGGRGGRVIKVTNLGDDGPGSLRAALRTEGPRTILFDISGTISLKRKIVVNNGRVTIAGQSAPGGGITLRNHGLVIKADDVIVRYIRSRPGSLSNIETDAISIGAGNHIIIDHCSASWATDETLSVSPTGENELHTIDNVTVQWSMITESLNNSIHSKGKHGYGSLVRGSAGARYSFHHNLWAHHKARMPRPGNYADIEDDPEGPLFDFRNNVFYNWGSAASGYNSDNTSVSRYNFINNYYRRGPQSSKSLAFDEKNSLAISHFSGNFMDGVLPTDPWKLVRFADERSRGSLRPFPAEPVHTQSAEQAYADVLRLAGASLARDKVDQRIVDQVQNGTGMLIDDVAQVGGWPLIDSIPALHDTDGDGMPDEWESAQGLNPGDHTDGLDDDDGDGYTNLEEYLNDLTTM